MTPRIEALGVVGAFVVMAVSNTLSQKRVFGGKDNKQISDENPTYVSPDGPTFAIWGFIYLFELVLVIAQLKESESAEAVLQRTCPLTGLNVRERIIAAFMANSVWLPVFNNEKFWAALLIMFMYLGLLISVYTDMNVKNTSGFVETLTLTTGIAMNTSWIVVASSVSVFFCGGIAGWKDSHHVAGSFRTGILVCVFVGALGCERVLRGGDVAWAFVAAWALRGIYRMQIIPDRVRFPLIAMNGYLAQTARTCSFLVVFAIIVRVSMMLYKMFALSS